MTISSSIPQDAPRETSSPFGIRNGAVGMSLGYIEIFDKRTDLGVAAVYSRSGNPYQIAKTLVASSEIAQENESLRLQIQDLIRERNQAQLQRESAENLVHLYQEELGVWSCCGSALRGKDEFCPNCEKANPIHSDPSKDF